MNPTAALQSDATALSAEFPRLPNMHLSEPERVLRLQARPVPGWAPPPPFIRRAAGGSSLVVYLSSRAASASVWPRRPTALPQVLFLLVFLSRLGDGVVPSGVNQLCRAPRA